MRKRILIAGGSHSDIPMIQAAKKLGYYVVTSGNRPSELGHAYSDEYRAADYSDKEAIYTLAKELKVDAICPSCNDFSALSASYAAEKLNLPGFDPYSTAMIIHHKDKYRQFAIENGITSPKAAGFGNMKSVLDGIEGFKFPLIIKPVDLSGGKGISLIRDREEIEKSVKNAMEMSKAKRIVIEEFIEGTRHGFSTFLINKKIKFYFTDNEYYYKNPYLVSGASTPGLIPDTAVKQLIAESERLATLLNLKDGIFHIQFILKNGIPYMIEICRRPPGDLYVNLVRHATGLDYPELIVKAFAGEDISDLRHHETKGFFTRHCVMGDSTGIVEDIFFDDKIKGNVIDKFMWWKKGGEINNILTDKHGIVFLKFGSFDEMADKSAEMQELIKVVVS